MAQQTIPFALWKKPKILGVSYDITLINGAMFLLLGGAALDMNAILMSTLIHSILYFIESYDEQFLIMLPHFLREQAYYD